MASEWHLYIISTQKGHLYTGISTDVARRFDEHLATSERRSSKGAKYFRTDKPIKVVYREVFPNRSEAQAREAQIKRYSATQKRALISS